MVSAKPLSRNPAYCAITLHVLIPLPRPPFPPPPPSHRMAAAAAASRDVAVGDDDGTKEAKDLTTEQWLAKFAAVKLKPDGKTPEYGEITRVANMDPAVSKSTFNHRWNTKDSRETAFGPAPALGVLEADMIQWIRDYRELGVKVSEIFVVHKALHVAK